MSCYPQWGSAVVCRPDDRFLRRRYQRCQFCDCITEQVIRFELWYPTKRWCCRCGDTWQGSYISERPFARNWRKRAVSEARSLWDRATYGPPPTLAEFEGNT